LRDDEGQLALHVLRHQLGARVFLQGRATAIDEPFPLTARAIQRVGRRLGNQIPDKQARRLRGRLITSGALVQVASYRQAFSPQYPTGWRVQLYRLARIASTKQVTTGQRPSKASVGTRPAVKRPERLPRWWEGPFGEPDGKPPPWLSRKQRRRWRSQDEMLSPRQVAAWA
jgi:hypothetical protein